MDSGASLTDRRTASILRGLAPQVRLTPYGSSGDLRSINWNYAPLMDSSREVTLPRWLLLNVILSLSVFCFIIRLSFDKREECCAAGRAYSERIIESWLTSEQGSSLIEACGDSLVELTVLELLFFNRSVSYDFMDIEKWPRIDLY